MLKKLLIALAVICGTCLTFIVWIQSLVPPLEQDFSNTTRSELHYLQQRPDIKRGKVLAVVTSTGVMGDSTKPTGYELTELARPYYVFTANGFTVDIASPKGGKPPAVIDQDDMGPFDYAFLNDREAQQKANHSLPIDQVSAGDYQAIFFVGGKGTMFDFPDNTDIQALVRDFHKNGKVIGAVCHGPAALANVTLDSGEPLIAGRQISAFTNEEELFLIPDAAQRFPFLLEDRLREQGAVFQGGPAYLAQVSVDGQLITGQNPWSTWLAAESMVKAMGYTPVPRQVTPAEQTVSLLLAYEQQGYKKAREKLRQLRDRGDLDRRLLAMHGMVSAMRWEPGKTLDIIRLLSNSQE
ncbi:type 1 glutamine amidotransferase domain-containing protein [Microbulbifer sp. 2205BS26-8]|uniref:type 1 glutamine amidotransferase domain-containing protein n=1 Tax=Microbulbifer sp. 2205BS26-8 TaxID=3064386 RepID=UPI00273FEC67|nr:type 1 glutamine amidotransferase domain-containing protein [Microbulbifer sp. 2205BS26-8]MDP5209706.1 type 1 glutamine amidotransferase domain-containing protein [Microbulbifer sp. 2205BS26-8]